MDELRADLNSLRSDIGELTRAVGELAGDEAEDIREALRRQAEAAKTRGRAAQQAFAWQMLDHPYASLGLSFGVGFLIAGLMGLSSRR